MSILANSTEIITGVQATERVNLSEVCLKLAILFIGLNVGN